MGSEGCRVCEVPEDEHRQLESRGVIHHKYSITGEIEKIERQPVKRKVAANEVMVVPGVDITLRQLLVEKGLLTEEELDLAGAIGYQSGGDRSPGASEEP